MLRYFTRDRFGRPQFLAAFLLFAFLAQALWLVHAELGVTQALDGDEEIRISEGLKQWHGRGVAGAPVIDPVDNPLVQLSWTNEDGFDSEHSPLLYLASAAPLLAWPHDLNAATSVYWRWLARIPFLACGVFLGASLWYVARRLCGNTGGFIALTFYAFSPSFIQSAAAWHTQPNIVAAWGAFGTIFTAIAVAHTLYAPREVVLWNWRRIVLLGVALAIGIGSQFSLIILAPMALGFLLYVAPVRRRAGVVIWLAACAVAFVLLVAVYFFQARAFAASMSDAHFWGFVGPAFSLSATYKLIATQVVNSCFVLGIALPITLVTYARSRRTRYFGNTAPLLVSALFIVLAMANPHTSGTGFLLASIPFLFIFVAGVLGDLLETCYRPLIMASVLALLIIHAGGTLLALAQVPRG
jgi:hypothetical protein